MQRLVVIEAVGHEQFVDDLRRAWDTGDAVLPLDPRLPPAARQQVLAAAELDRPVDPGDAVVVATSGTTGAPRLAVLTHDALAASATATSARLGVDPRSDRWLACLPLAHVGGLGVVVRALFTGTPLTLLPRPDPATVGDAARAGCTLTSLVPTALARIDPAAFRAVLVGGQAPPSPRPANVIATYGLTETGGGVVYEGEALDGVELRTDARDGRGRPGEILVRGPMLARGYRDGTDPRNPDGWLPTGDVGELADGRLRVHGRRGEVIITGGENVWPAAVERVLAAHPGVHEVAVTGRPDPEWGQAVIAVVVPADHARPPSLDDLRAHAKVHLPAYAAPRRLELVAALPRSVLGKVRRAALG